MPRIFRIATYGSEVEITNSQNPVEELKLKNLGYETQYAWLNGSIDALSIGANAEVSMQDTSVTTIKVVTAATPIEVYIQEAVE